MVCGSTTAFHAATRSCRSITAGAHRTAILIRHPSTARILVIRPVAAVGRRTATATAMGMARMVATGLAQVLHPPEARPRHVQSTHPDSQLWATAWAEVA